MLNKYIVNPANWVGSQIAEGIVCIADGVIKTAEVVFDDRFLFLGAITGPVGDMGKGLGKMIEGKPIDGADKLYNGFKRLFIHMEQMRQALSSAILTARRQGSIMRIKTEISPKAWINKYNHLLFRFSFRTKAIMEAPIGELRKGLCK